MGLSSGDDDDILMSWEDLGVDHDGAWHTGSSHYGDILANSSPMNSSSLEAGDTPILCWESSQHTCTRRQGNASEGTGHY